jgi:VWFA-related protein
MLFRLRTLFAFVASSTVLLYAQAAPPQPSFHAEANYVRVDVHATASGAPVEDLSKEDFEILDNGTPQTISDFEQVNLRGVGSLQAEPGEMRDATPDNPRARVYVLFLDTYHVETAGSHDIRGPLVKLLDHVIQENDLIGVMTPQMSVQDIMFERKATNIAAFLTSRWDWGDRDRLNASDPEKDEYKACYPGFGPTPNCLDDDEGIADEMIDRLREKRTLDALDDLVGFLRTARPERKAVIAISDGWVLYRPDSALANRPRCQPTLGAPRAGIGVSRGRIATNRGSLTTSKCESDKFELAQLNDEIEFRQIIQEANSANISFYPVDPRGVVVYDSGLDRPAGQTAQTDLNKVSARAGTLRRFADETDGMAVVGAGNLDAAMRRIAADLTSYYLIGYYTTTRLDGKFHSITVRIKRPGVRVRARRGYLAAKAADGKRTPPATAP